MKKICFVHFLITQRMLMLQEWKNMRSDLEPAQWAYVQNLSEFQSIDTSEIEYLMGKLVSCIAILYKEWSSFFFFC